MMKYEMRYEKNGEGGQLAAFYVDGQPVETEDILSQLEQHETTIQAQQANLQIAADLLEEERAKVAHRDELLRIQGEACERYKAEIEEARQFIRYLFPLDPSDIRYANKDAGILIAKWEETETEANDGTPVIHLPPKASEGAPPPRITYSIDTEAEGEA